MVGFDEEIKKILKDDPLDLLQLQTNNTISKDQRLVESFEEINEFVDKEGRKPDETKDINEIKLFSRLDSIKRDFEKVLALKAHDKHNLLADIKEAKTVEDILSNDSLGILDDDPESIFSLKHISKFKSKTDYVAKRKPCKNFISYESKFQNIHNELSSEKRKLIPFKEVHLKEGRYYILDGILFFLEKIGLAKIKIFHDRSQGTRKRVDPRTRCIFENGLESDMYLRSLQKEMYKNGNTVIESNEESLDEFNKNFEKISENDNLTGYIYILSSMSNNAEIRTIKNLYKIGYSTTAVEERIKNAEKDPTFLMGKVNTISIYKTYNLNPQKFENIIHSFFSEKCLDIKIKDNQDQYKKPKEWYVVPINIIEKVIELIINNEIKNYKYDAKTEELVSLK